MHSFDLVTQILVSRVVTEVQLLVLSEFPHVVRSLDVTRRPQCSSFRVIVAGLSLGDVVEVGVGNKEVEDESEGESNRGKIGERSSNMDEMWMGVKVCVSTPVTP